MIRVVLAAALILCGAELASAQIIPGPGFQLQDEGSPLGRANTLNCVGTGVTCTLSGGIATLTASGGGGTASGSSTNVQFNCSGAFCGDSRFTWNYNAASLTVAGGTHTTSNPVLATTETWNAGGVAFTHELHQVTSTASAAGSLLVDYQVGGSSVFKVDKAGVITTVNFGGLQNPTGNVFFGSAPADQTAAMIIGAAGPTLISYDSGGGLGLGYLFAGRINLGSGYASPITTVQGQVGMLATHLANLGTPGNGALAYCDDCDPPTLVDSTCTSAGAKTGSLAFRVNGAWKCIS